MQGLTSSNKALTERLNKLEKSEDEMQKLKLRAEELESELREYKQTHVDAKQVPTYKQYMKVT